MAKKNQHFIPKFYLRNFSYHLNQKEIGIYVPSNDFFKNDVALRDQGSKKFFYGKDEIIENQFASMEKHFANSVNTIISNQNLNKKNRKELFELLTFVLFSDLRNPIIIGNVSNFPTNFNDLKLPVRLPELEHLESVKITLSTVKSILPFLLDLDYKLFINITNAPFITSDYPCAKYNILYEDIPTFFSVFAYRSKGFLLFYPISSNLTIIFFDKSTYRIGNKRDNVIQLNDKKEIDQLNTLQILNANETIYFNESISYNYIKELFRKSNKYQKGNKSITSTSKFERANGVIDENPLIVTRQIDSFINLKLNAIKIHSGCNKKLIDPTRIILRN